MSFSEERLYLKPNRLSDVLALIQILAFHKFAHRDEENLIKELQIQPRLASSWQSLAAEHPEFFRVKTDADNPVALIARHATPVNATGGREPLDGSTAQHLIDTAIELHDRQIKREDRWTLTAPIWAAANAAVVACGLKFIDVVLSLCLAAR